MMNHLLHWKTPMGIIIIIMLTLFPSYSAAREFKKGPEAHPDIKRNRGREGIFSRRHSKKHAIIDAPTYRRLERSEYVLSNGLKDANKPYNHYDDLAVLEFKEILRCIGIIFACTVVFAANAGIPNLGFGPHVDFGFRPFLLGCLMTLPAFALNVALGWIHKIFPALGLGDVEKSSQKLTLELFGGSFHPWKSLAKITAVGLAVGLWEELFFRGVLQYGLGRTRIGDGMALLLSSIVFGVGHCYTPLYAALGALLGIYSGWVYLSTGNLAVVIYEHAIYDILLIFDVHLKVTKISLIEQTELYFWKPGGLYDFAR